MRSVSLTASVPGLDAATAYARLCDFSAYPALSEAVRAVTVTAVDGPVSLSTWEVSFRNGILRWTEEDTFDDAARTITFTQLEGDVDEFAGQWRSEPAGPGCEVHFTARLDLGIPTLADVLEPIAVRALVDNTRSVLHGLFGADVEVRDTEAVAR